MNIHLRVSLEPPLEVDEALLRAGLPDTLRAMLKALAYLGGELALSAEGQPPLVLRDDLEQLVPRLCLRGLPALEQGKPVTVPLFTDPSAVTFTPEADNVHIDYADTPRLTVPCAALADALERYGANYVALVDAVFPGDATRRAKLASLRVLLLERETRRLDNAPLRDEPELPNLPDDD
ncbi:MAG: hypothetical protein MUC74_14745 [Ideonella sp.]|nr:hypothetical protein [Ideonella sp.]